MLASLRFKYGLVLSTLAFSMVLPNNSWARSELDNRVKRLENIVENELNIQLLNQLEAMQQEIRELHGKLEEQQNSVQMLNQKQEKIFINLDSRLNTINPPKSIESQPEQPQPVVPPAPPVPPDTPVATSTHLPTPDQTSISSVVTSEKDLYDSAYNLTRAKLYPEAIIEFKDLLWQYPEGTYAAQAYYWLGELYFVQWQQNRADKNLLAQAKESFATITNKYQGQDREGDALLKLALIEIDLDHFAVAKDILLQVVTKYPNTARARIAENNLARIEQARITPQ